MIWAFLVVGFFFFFLYIRASKILYHCAKIVPYIYLCFLSFSDKMGEPRTRLDSTIVLENTRQLLVVFTEIQHV